MNPSARFSFRWGDCLAIGLVLALAIGLWVLCLPTAEVSEDAVVQIYRDGKLLQELPLFSTRELTLSGKYENTVCIDKGRVCFSHSTCPGEDCVHSGWISRPGRSLVCLPNGVELRISGSSDVDFAVR